MALTKNCAAASLTVVRKWNSVENMVIFLIKFIFFFSGIMNFVVILDIVYRRLRYAMVIQIVGMLLTRLLSYVN